MEAVTCSDQDGPPITLPFTLTCPSIPFHTITIPCRTPTYIYIPLLYQITQK